LYFLFIKDIYFVNIAEFLRLFLAIIVQPVREMIDLDCVPLATLLESFHPCCLSNKDTLVDMMGALLFDPGSK